MEPYELLTVDVEEEHQGSVMEELGRRKGELTDMEPGRQGPCGALSTVSRPAA